MTGCLSGVVGAKHFSSSNVITICSRLQNESLKQLELENNIWKLQKEYIRQHLVSQLFAFQLCKSQSSIVAKGPKRPNVQYMTLQPKDIVKAFVGSYYGKD